MPKKFELNDEITILIHDDAKWPADTLAIMNGRKGIITEICRSRILIDFITPINSPNDWICRLDRWWFYPEDIMQHAEPIQAYITKPKSIDMEHFYEMLGCMPPDRWHKVGGFEVFHLCEKISGDIVTWFARKGGMYFKFNDLCTLDDKQIHDRLAAV